MTYRAPNKSNKSKVLGAAATAAAIAGYIAYVLITGDLSGLNDFTGQDLTEEGNRFRGQDLVRAVFNQANISGLDMAWAQLQDSEMIEVTAEETYLYGANFLRADLTDANFRGAILVEAVFRGANLTGADFRGADLRGVTFENATLDRADFRNSFGGPACRSRDSVPDHCTEGEDCCAMVWTQARTEGMLACRDPYYDIMREVQGTGFSWVGEVEWSETIDFANAYPYCSEPSYVNEAIDPNNVQLTGDRSRY